MKFYFKLINAILDASAQHTSNFNNGKKIKYISKNKEGFNPVSKYDRKIENSIVNIVKVFDPEAKIYGEEFNYSCLKKNNIWIIDPIDGTRSFICGSPIWGTLIALIKNDCLIFGALDHPALGERLIGMSNITYYKNKSKDFVVLKKIKDDTKRIEQYIIATSSYHYMNKSERLLFSNLVSKVQQVIYNYDCYAYTMLIKGYIDAVIDCNLKLYDIAGLVPLLKGVGYEIYNWQGKDVCFDTKIIVSKAGMRENILNIMKENLEDVSKGTKESTMVKSSR